MGRNRPFCYAESETNQSMLDTKTRRMQNVRSVRDYLRNIAPTPAAYRAIRAEAKKNGSGLLSMSEIEREIAANRQARKKSVDRLPE